MQTARRMFGAPVVLLFLCASSRGARWANLNATVIPVASLVIFARPCRLLLLNRRLPRFGKTRVLSLGIRFFLIFFETSSCVRPPFNCLAIFFSYFFLFLREIFGLCDALCHLIPTRPLLRHA